MFRAFLVKIGTSIDQALPLYTVQSVKDDKMLVSPMHVYICLPVLPCFDCPPVTLTQFLA